MGHNHDNGGKVKGFMVGSLIGGLVGSSMALLFAPKQGKKVRKDLSKKYNYLSHRTHDFCEDMGDKCKHFLHQMDKAAEKSKKRTKRKR